MRKVELRMNEQEKYEIIKELADHNGNKNRASKKLGISRRQIDRLIIKYKEKGKSGFVHGNRSKKPINALDKSISEDIILLYQKKYYGFNFNHFKDFLESDENIKVSYKYIYNTLTKAGILSPKARKITKRKLKKEQLIKEKKVDINVQNEKDIEKIIDHEIALEDSHPRGEKPKYFGELIEQDGSIHLWFGEHKTCLHLAADKATNTIVGAYFDNQETLNGYYKVFYQILTNYGIPYKFFTDNRTVFNYMSLNPDKRTSEKDVLTQYGYACKQLGIELETSSISQAKGLIERDNETFQDRLVQELRLYGITTIDAANEYLINTFVPNFNKRFAMDYTKFKSVFEQTPSIEKINYTLAVLTPRKIDNGNAIKYKNKYYQPYFDDKIKCFKPKTECLVIKSYTGELFVSIDEKVFELRELERNKKFSENFNETNTTSDTKPKTYIPSMQHPWKVAEFRKQQRRARLKHLYA